MSDTRHTFPPILLFCVLAFSAVAQPLGNDLAVREAAPGVYVVIHTYPWSSNSLAVLMGDRDLLLVDTPCTPEATGRLLDWADRHFPGRSKTAINTHYHVDRLGGNPELKRRGIPVYGSNETARLLAEKGEWARKLTMGWISDPAIREVYRTMRFLPPDHLFPERDGLKLQLGNEAVEVFYPGPGHTPDNLVVYLPAKKVLFGGCFIVGMEKLGNLAEADVAGWRASLERLSRFDARVVVPGHGGEARNWSPELIRHTRRLLQETGTVPSPIAPESR